MKLGGFAQQPIIEEDKPALRWVSGEWWVVASLQTPPAPLTHPVRRFGWEMFDRSHGPPWEWSSHRSAVVPMCSHGTTME